jgi:Rrf2 family protein
MSAAVEWGIHITTLLAQVPGGRPLPRRVLSEHFGLPEDYLAKQLQVLVRAGVLHATPGPQGGFRLARPAAQITVLDVVDAIEGTGTPPFRCQEIRQQGAGAVPAELCTKPCAISGVMAAAHEAWRTVLRKQTVGALVGRVPAAVRESNRRRYAAPRPG